MTSSTSLFRPALALAALFVGVFLATVGGFAQETQSALATQSVQSDADGTIRQGKQIFRFDTFGDESFWGDTLKLHEAIEGAKLGGVGPGVSPNTALAVGLKVDVDALPPAIVNPLKEGKVNLNDPATTIALLNLDAVVGVKGFVNSGGSLDSIGIRCALCHSVVDNSLAPGIGHRLDGWANRDLNVGAIVSLAPNLDPIADVLGVDVSTVRKVLAAWGPGHFDAELLLDGKGFRPDGKTAATLIPPAFGLAGVNLHTWTGWGSVTYWNAFVANIEMHGKGAFFDPRLDAAGQFPIAAKNRFGHIMNDPDLITPKLAALHFYQLALPAPIPPRGGFNEEAAERGDALFNGKAQCARCHTTPLYTEPGWNMHTPEDVWSILFNPIARPTSVTVPPLSKVSGRTKRAASITTAVLPPFLPSSIITTAASALVFLPMKGVTWWNF